VVPRRSRARAVVRGMLDGEAPMKYLSSVAFLAILVVGCGGGGGDDGGDDDPLPADPTAGAWRHHFAPPGLSGSGSRVEDIAIDDDGDVYVGGIFGAAAGLPVANVAVWTGNDWEALGDGLDGWVRAIGFDGAGTLWAAYTTPAFEGALASWDGATWTVAATLDGQVRDMVLAGDDPVIVGDFTGSVVRWDGAEFRGFGAVSGGAESIAVSAEGFCIAGSFDAVDGVAADNAACWDGVGWTPLGRGLPGGVAVLARSQDGTWYAGGTLTFVTDPRTGAYEAGIAVLDGDTWAPFEGGIDNGWINEVRAIAFDGDDVLVGGHFLTAGRDDVPVSHLARWSPTGGWSDLAGGVRSGAGVFLEYIRGGHDLVVADDGTLWIGGIFTTIGDATAAANLARVAPSGQASALVGARPVLGIGGFVDGVAAGADGTVLAGGLFEFAGTTRARNLARYDGSTWTEVGGVAGIVRAVLTRGDGTVAVAGELIVDARPAAFAVWDGDRWQLPGGRVDGAGFALVEAPDGALWLAGDLYEAAGAPVSHAIRLDGAAWTAAGEFDARVTSLAVHDGAVVAGGMFTTIDGAAIAGLAVRAADGWTALGGGLDGDFAYVSALASSDAVGLVVGGSFDGVGGRSISTLARWDGSSWSDLGTGFSADVFTIVTGLHAFGGGVFATGAFTAIGGAEASNLAWFDGAAWHDLGGGLDDLAEELVVVDDVLYIGGPFTEAGGRPASGFAAWDFAGE
jgi:trimeric autotransporter adhesin